MTSIWLGLAEKLLAPRPDTAIYLAELLARRLNDATTTMVDLKQHFHAQADRVANVRLILEGLPRQRSGV
jgi:hypothetical protein